MKKSNRIAFNFVAIVCAVWVSMANSASAIQSSLLSSIFQDHVVLQRDQPISIWGHANPNKTLVIEFVNQKSIVVSDAKGNWHTHLPATPAGGPYTLTVNSSDGETQTITDVLTGDVWLCSGQSNMELQVNAALYARMEVAQSTNDSIRMLTIANSSNALPQTEFSNPLIWKKASPENTGDFSAACYFFARELQQTVKVPMGLINASWGGSKIEAWLSESALHGLHRYDGDLDILHLYAKDAAAANPKWGARWQQWWHDHPQVARDDEPWRAVNENRNHTDSFESRWRNTPTELTNWESWGVPELANYDGMVWYRTTVKLDAKQAKKSAVLLLGAVDEVDTTWVNGVVVGSTAGAGTMRDYKLPPGLLHAGVNTIVVSALDTWAIGGMYGSAQNRALQLGADQPILLDGHWQYQIPLKSIEWPPRAPWESIAGLGTIYNGMIAPLRDYSLRGAVWYQGESNTDNAIEYRELLTQLMNDWRRTFGALLPVLVVQLPNFGMPSTQPVESGWAQLRDSQRKAVMSDAHAGLAITIDIGDKHDLHPMNKQEVGRRLARVARHVVYGEVIAPSGAVAVSAIRQGSNININFSDVTGKLLAYSASDPIGFELCGTEVGSCHYVAATITNDAVMLHSTQAATRVRYCWADSPVCTLSDESELPAEPFELMIQ